MRALANAANAAARPYSLRPGFQLQLHGQRAYVVRHRDGARLAALTATEAVFVNLMDGRRSAAELAALASAALGDSCALGVQHLLERLAPLVHDGPATTRSLSLLELSRALAPDPHEGIRLLPGPRVLHWHVTQYCPRRCAYCYADPLHGSAATDATVPLEVMARVFEEAVDLGASHLLLSGAEPLLRTDLPEAIEAAIGRGLEILLTTKYPVSADLAKRLARAGLRHLSLSLDTLDAAHNHELIGSSRYADQMSTAMRNLIDAGVQFSIQSVVTPINIDALEALALFAEKQGATVMQLVPYKDVRSPIGNLQNSQLRLPDDTLVDKLCEKLAVHCSRMRIERFKEASDTGTFYCDIGQTKLLILPDGVVHRCYKLTSDAALRGRDLKSSSVAQAWHDPQFVDTILPKADLYGDVPCGTCGSKSTCDRSGRCIYDAYVHHGRYASPDRGCHGRAHLQLGNVRIIPIQVA
jgi:radical SAM protein with 4Fe4S-binding SPASM domain